MANNRDKLSSTYAIAASVGHGQTLLFRLASSAQNLNGIAFTFFLQDPGIAILTETNLPSRNWNGRTNSQVMKGFIDDNTPN